MVPVVPHSHMNKIGVFDNPTTLTTDLRHAAANTHTSNYLLLILLCWFPSGLGSASHPSESHNFLPIPCHTLVIYLFRRSPSGSS